MKQSPYLTETENKAVELLAQGKRMRDVREACNFHNGPTQFFYAFLAEIRRKTAIENVQDTHMCRAFLNAIENTPPIADLTERQTRLFEYALRNMPHSQQAVRLDITEAEVAAQFKSALVQCGIFSNDARTIRAQIRMHFAIQGHHYSTHLPLSSTHWKVLRVLADGESVAEVLGYRDREAFNLIRDACKRAHITCTGNGTQRILAKLFLDSRQAKPEQPAPITPDDPAF